MAVLFNYIWASADSKQDIGEIIGIFYTILYFISIVILICFTSPGLMWKFLTEAQKSYLGVDKRPCHLFSAGLPWVALFLGVASIVYCLAALGVFLRAFPNTNLFLIFETNYGLCSLKIFLEIIFLFQSRFSGEFLFSKVPKSLCGLKRLAKMHLLITNVSLWIKIIATESVRYALEYHKSQNTTNHEILYRIDYNAKNNLTILNEFTIPPFIDSCAAFGCFKNPDNPACEGKNNLWTLEQGFFCKDSKHHHFDHTFYPFFAEFCTMMVCIFYEMFSHQETSVKDTDSRASVAPITLRKPPFCGLVLGFVPIIPVIVIKAIPVKCEEDILVKQGTLYLILCIFNFVPLVLSLLLTKKQSSGQQHEPGRALGRDRCNANKITTEGTPIQSLH